MYLSRISIHASLSFAANVEMTSRDKPRYSSKKISRHTIAGFHLNLSKNAIVMTYS